MRTSAALGFLLVLAGCATARPVLYPNDQMQRVGDAAAQRDIDACMQRASQYVSSSTHTREVAGSTAAGAGAGAAIGAVGGAISGSAGTGAAVGAATGGTAGLLHGIFGTRGPDPVYQNFVDRCLRERGYDPIGWK